jgi:hypothetical protein
MRGASAIVTFAGLDAVDAGDAALRGLGVTSVFGQDGSAPALPLAWRRPGLRWKDSLDSVMDDQIETRPANCLRPPVPSWTLIVATDRSPRRSADKPKKHRMRNAGHYLCPAPSESPDALTCGRPHSHQAQGCNGHPAFRTPSPRGRGGNAHSSDAQAPRECERMFSGQWLFEI